MRLIAWHLVLGAALVGCRHPSQIDDVPPIGSLEGHFSCPVVDEDASDFDLGQAGYDGELDLSDYEEDLRTQGCFARQEDARRGPVITALLVQLTDFDKAQVLSLSFPDDGELDAEQEAYFSRDGGFASLYVLEDGDAEVIARSAGGAVTVMLDEAGDTEVLVGSFSDLRMGER